MPSDSISSSATTRDILDVAEPAEAVLSAAVKTQLLRCQLGGGGGTLWMEVVRSRQGRVEVLCSGELLQLSVTQQGQVAAAAAGFLPRLGDAWVKATPGLADALKKVRQQQADDSSLPSQLIAAHGVAWLQPLQPLQTLAQFRASVAAAPGPWCDGTVPGDPPPTEQDVALLTAGELAAFLEGQRGVCLLQLHKGWGDRSSGLQALLRPWVLPLLQAAAEHKGVALLRSAAPQELGASLVLCARQQPFHAWGKCLASQGVQAAIVADSPYYKLLIGRILGYREHNIHHHIQVSGSFRWGAGSGEAWQGLAAGCTSTWCMPAAGKACRLPHVLPCPCSSPAAQ